eukprot:NODE_8617_length_544_cov_51.040767_g8594_i0.p1 GENE.NODE_8617_length_544_cov_51.040767_g8594_i0~~NODE_8617_length_544_cov_51.040767_g8594_i0.p1  ORF type:complete len:145 (-),score=25.46 NODE_8617_length_544_cov_51.040767_g8594_i0:51-485(-)
MPSFVCTGCSESYTKKAAEAHLQNACRKLMNCADCHKGFDASTIGAHTSCITESEKYASGYHNNLQKRKDRQDERAARNSSRAERRAVALVAQYLIKAAAQEGVTLKQVKPAKVDASSRKTRAAAKADRAKERAHQRHIRSQRL